MCIQEFSYKRRGSRALVDFVMAGFSRVVLVLLDCGLNWGGIVTEGGISVCVCVCLFSLSLSL